MGWSSGSRLCNDIILQMANTDLSEDDRKTVYEFIIKSFEDYDCDNLSECLGIDIAFDKAYKDVSFFDGDDDSFINDDDEDSEE